MRQSDKEGSVAAFAKAIELLGRIPAKESLYHRAQSRIGECLVLSEKPDEGRKHLEAFLQKNAAFFADPNTPPARRQPQGWAMFWLATAYNDMKQPAKVIEVLADFENKFKGASLENSIPRVRYLRIRAMDAAGRLADAEKEILALRNDSPESPWTAPAALAVASALYHGQSRMKETDPTGAKSMLGRAADLYDFWLAGTPEPSSDNFVFVGKVNQEVGHFDRASEALAKALTMEETARNTDKADTIRANLVGLLIDQEKYAEALPRLEHLFIKPQADLSALRAFFTALDTRHPSIDLGVHKEGVKKALQGIVARASLLPAGAPIKEKAERIVQAADPNVEQLMAAYDDAGPAARTALANGCALGTLASTNALSPNVRTTTFELVKRTPDLMSHIARCHEAQATKIDSGITAINLLQMLIESAPSSDPEVRVDGHRYTARWFEWKYRLMGVYRTLGISLNQDRPLQTVCDLYRSMTTLNEIQMAEAIRPGFGKKFDALRDEVETALRRLGKTGGCQ
jgi:tetratricopeptide (TPR) repeat protein